MPAESTNQMTLLPSPATVKAPAEQFTGDVWVDGITSAAGDGTATLAANAASAVCTNAALRGPTAPTTAAER